MVNLTRIYTRTGDQGETRLSDNSVSSKTDPRVAAYGDVDEVNSLIGVVLATEGLSPRMAEVLTRVQNELFDVGADLSNPLRTTPEWEPLRITDEAVERLERWCDEFGDPLPNLRSFVLPGGSMLAARLHVARSVARRAERSGWLAAQTYGIDQASEADDQPGGVNSVALRYLNRLSDLLFIMARHAVTDGGRDVDAEVLWVPGGERETPDEPDVIE